MQVVLRASVLSAITLASSAIAQQPGGGAPLPPAVTVVTMKAEDVTLTSSLPGRVIASAEAELRPQVSGIIMERTFTEGRMVAEGDALFRIDPRTYEANVAQAEASLAQAQARANDAQREAERIATLRDRSVASQQTVDSAIAAQEAADAAVKAAEAALDVAKIDLDRTTIRAPLEGVIGLAQASQGALVTASQATPLAVIRRIDPVQVDVTQSAAEIIRWRRQGPNSTLPSTADDSVALHLADGTEYSHKGSLTAAEPHVDETTGVVTLRMEFENPDRLLLPGMYVLAQIPQARLEDVILAPQEGVTRDRRGRPTAYVVNADNVVEERMLDILQDHGNTWVVREGLAPGDRLIVSGIQFIAPGATVTPEERQDPATDEAPAQGADAASPDASTTDAAAETPAGAAPPEAETAAAPANAADAPAEPDATEGQPAAPGDTPAGN